MVGEVEITVGVERGQLDDISDALHPDRALKLRVQKHPGACWACVANDDPERVPVHTRPPCRCTVVFDKT